MHAPMAQFARTVLRRITWRAFLITQALGCVFALYPWLETLGQPQAAPVISSFMEQALAALFVMLAAFAGDEAVRRGWSVWRALLVGLLFACSATAIVEWGIDRTVGLVAPAGALRQAVNTFLEVGSYWGIGSVLMLYLNRQSAERILAGVRAGELARLTAERRLLTSRRATAEMQLDPDLLLRRLGEVRDQYARGETHADQGLDQLIAELRDRAARATAAADGTARS